MATAPGAADVRIEVDDPVVPTDAGIQVSADSVIFRWSRLGSLSIRENDLIRVQPHPQADPAVLAEAVVHLALAVLLFQRGLFPLHASAVDIGGSVIAFAGESGAGKSTTAAAFVAQGAHSVADDVVAVRLGDVPLVYPALPQLKLLPDAVDRLGLADEAQVEFLSKRIYRPEASFDFRPLPLRALYLLERGATTQIERLTGAQMLVEVFPNSYLARLRRLYGVNYLEATHTTAQHFQLISRLLSQVPIFRLRRSFASGELADLPSIVLADLTNT